MKKHTQDTFADTLSRDERRQAHRLMVEQFHEILERSQGGGIYWAGTKTDLIELTYEMFTAGTMTDALGRPCSFIAIVEKVCSILHVTQPANPYSLIQKARVRKGIRQQSFFSRYCWMLMRKGKRNPLHAMLRRLEVQNAQRQADGRLAEQVL